MRTIVKGIATAATLAIAACASSGAEQPVTRASRPDSPIATRHPYEMKGRVQAVGGGFLGMGGRSVTIAREDAPPAVVHVADRTRIDVDGRVSRLGDLRPGDDVRVVFDFDKDAPVALEIVARPHR
jgi:hypothetical protein